MVTQLPQLVCFIQIQFEARVLMNLQQMVLRMRLKVEMPHLMKIIKNV